MIHSSHYALHTFCLIKYHFSHSCLDLICEGARNICGSNGHEIEELPNVEDTCELIDMVAKDFKQRLREKPIDKQFLLGSHKFVQRYVYTELRRTMHY